jgi:hypothetical protein
MHNQSEHYQPEHLTRWGSKDPAFGSTDNYVGADLSAFYQAPISMGRDTADALTLSNWAVISEELESLAEHEESGEAEFGHWAVGWYRLWLIHESDTAALQCADQWAATLADYPVADEQRLSELEIEQEEEHWERWGSDEWQRSLIKQLEPFAPDDADAYWADDVVESLPPDTLQQWFWDLGSVEHESDGPSFTFPELTIEQLAELTGLPLLPADQEWRREPYPWAGADPSPLSPALISNP